MKKYIAIRRLWLSGENRHAEPGEEVKLDDEAGAVLLERGSVELAAGRAVAVEPAPVEVVAMRPVWSATEQRDIRSGETFTTSADGLNALIESGVVRLPVPDVVEAKPTKGKRKDNE